MKKNLNIWGLRSKNGEKKGTGKGAVAVCLGGSDSPIYARKVLPSIVDVDADAPDQILSLQFNFKPSQGPSLILSFFSDSIQHSLSSFLHFFSLILPSSTLSLSLPPASPLRFLSRCPFSLLLRLLFFD